MRLLLLYNEHSKVRIVQDISELDSLVQETYDLSPKSYLQIYDKDFNEFVDLEDTSTVEDKDKIKIQLMQISSPIEPSFLENSLTLLTAPTPSFGENIQDVNVIVQPMHLQQWPYEVMLPFKDFSGPLKETLNSKKNLAWDHTREIIGHLANYAYSFKPYPNKKERLQICESLIQQYPYLRNDVGAGVGGWEIKLLNKLKKLRQGDEFRHSAIICLSLDELVAQCVTFFMAGYDATISLLTNALYHLSKNERHQERVLQEMKEAMQKRGGIVNYDTLSELKYLDAVLNECLRLCPSMVRNERRVENDCTLPETGIRLRKGMIISIPVYAIHRDPQWYPEPELFRPDRFMGTEPSRPSLVHIPFGAGPRVCVGYRFVMMQVKLCLTRLLLRFHATPAATTPEHLAMTEVRNILKINDIDISLKERIL